MFSITENGQIKHNHITSIAEAVSILAYARTMNPGVQYTLFEDGYIVPGETIQTVYLLQVIAQS